MLELYNKILNKTASSKGLNQVDVLVNNSGCTTEVNNRLIAEGYPIQNLNYKQKAIFFVALVDIIVVVKDNTYYLATFNTAKITELYQLGRVIPSQGETDLSNVDKLMRYNTKEVICQYLYQQKKFHLLKLNLYDKTRTNFTLVSVTSMNPYPSFDGNEMIFALSDMARWHNTLSNELIKGIYCLKTSEGDVICQNYLGKPMSVCTGGYLLAKDMNNNLIELPLWSISDYEAYNVTDFIQKLYKGIVKYDNFEITLNRDILVKYYGEKMLFTQLESKGVRYRYCLEELLSLDNKYSVSYYISKYALDIDAGEIQSIYELETKLRGLCAKDMKPENIIVNARVLASPKQILSKHVPFYVKINISKLANHSIKVIENVADVLPKNYNYYGLNSSLGYNCVVVKATSDTLAENYGKAEFERQFGADCKFIGLCTSDKLIKGMRPYKFSIDSQVSLCQNIKYGYKENYKGYAKVIYNMLSLNNINNCTDEIIQLLYINQLARKYKYGADVTLFDVMFEFLNLCELLHNPDELHKKLVDAKAKISYKQCVREYEHLISLYPNFSGYKVDDTPDGKFIVTNYGRYKLGKLGLNKTVDLYYKGEYLCSKIMKG